MLRNNLRFLKIQLYALKREYGSPISLYRQTIGDTDVETGEKSITRVSYDIRLGIVLPVKFETTSFYSAAFLKFAREFAYGDYKDIETKKIIIDGVDLPINFEIIPEDFIVYDHRRFEIKYIEKLSNGIGYQMIAQHLTGSPTNEIFNLSVKHDLRFLQLVGGEL